MPMPMYNYNYGYYPQQQQTQPQIQNGGLISVRSEAEARSYPIAPGNSITFKDENSPYVYTKTMGFSQLDRPTFEKFRLVKEEASQTPQSSFQGQEVTPNSTFVQKAEFEALRDEFRTFKEEIKNEQRIHAKPSGTSKKSDAVSYVEEV